MPDGEYVVHYFVNNGYESLASASFEVSIDDGATEEESEEEAEVESDSELAEINEEIEVIASTVEELAEDPDASVDELRALADSHLEERMSGLSDHQKDRLRGFLGAKLDSIEEKVHGSISSDSGVSKGIAAAGAAAATTAVCWKCWTSASTRWCWCSSSRTSRCAAKWPRSWTARASRRGFLGNCFCIRVAAQLKSRCR